MTVLTVEKIAEIEDGDKSQSTNQSLNEAAYFTANHEEKQRWLFYNPRIFATGDE